MQYLVKYEDFINDLTPKDGQESEVNSLDKTVQSDECSDVSIDSYE